MKKGTTHTNESKQKNAESQRRNAQAKRGSDQAVSPVIGVILMVAITVILAAVVAAFMFGMSGNIGKSHLAVVTADKIADDSISILVQSGSDLAGLIVNLNDGDQHIIGNVASPLGDQPLEVGSSAQVSSSSQDRINHVVITGVFLDGTKQVILDKVF